MFVSPWIHHKRKDKALFGSQIKLKLIQEGFNGYLQERVLLALLGRQITQAIKN